MTKRISSDIRKKVACTLITSMLVGASCGFVNADNGYDNANYKDIGYVSMVGEVGVHGNPGFISSGKGDAGGKSYGVSQFTSKGGGASANGFVKWMKKHYPEMGKNFDGVGKAGTGSFDEAWKKTYNEHKDEFGKVQMEYTGKNYVEPFVRKAKEEFGVDFNSTRALMELTYSTTVQFGVNGTMQVLRNAGVNSGMSEMEILEKATAEKQNSVGTYKFLGCSQDVRNSVKNRFARELKEFKDIANGVADIEGVGSSDDVSLDDLVDGSNGDSLDSLVDGDTTSEEGALDDLVNGDDSNEGTLDDLIENEGYEEGVEEGSNSTEEGTENGELDDLVNGDYSEKENDKPVEEESGSLDNLIEGGNTGNQSDKVDDNTENNAYEDTKEEGSLDDLVDGEGDSKSNDNDSSNQDNSNEKVEVEDDKEVVEDNSAEEKEESKESVEEETNKEEGKEETTEDSLDGLVEESVEAEKKGEQVQNEITEEKEDSVQGETIKKEPVQEDKETEEITKEEATKEEAVQEDKETKEETTQEEPSQDDSSKKEIDKENDKADDKAVNDTVESPVEAKESEDAIAKLEKELENNMFGKLFKTTKDLLNNEKGADEIVAKYMA